MTTYLSDITSRIADDLNRSDLTTQTYTAVNRAIKHYEKEPFWFKETTGTFVTIASQQSYGTADGLPSDISRINRLEITLSAGRYFLTPRNINWIQNQNPNGATGDPTDYAWWQNKIWLSLTPNQVNTITAYYTKTYADLDIANPTSSANDWLTYAEDLIEARARKWIYARILKDPDNAALAAQEEMEALNALLDKNEGHTAQAAITPTVF